MRRSQTAGIPDLPHYPNSCGCSPAAVRIARPERRTPVNSHRIRAVAAGLPIVLLSVVLAASPGFAAESLRISTPLANSTVTGDLLVQGSLDADSPVDLSIGLARQSLGDCGSLVTENRLADTSDDFVTTFATTSISDGTYCLVAVADAGRISTVIADITVANTLTASEALDGLQLPTLPFEGDSEGGPEAVPLAAETSIVSDLGVLAPAVLGATAIVSALVLVFGLWARRHFAN